MYATRPFGLPRGGVSRTGYRRGKTEAARPKPRRENLADVQTSNIARDTSCHVAYNILQAVDAFLDARFSLFYPLLPNVGFG